MKVVEPQVYGAPSKPRSFFIVALIAIAGASVSAYFLLKAQNTNDRHQSAAPQLRPPPIEKITTPIPDNTAPEVKQVPHAPVLSASKSNPSENSSPSIAVKKSLTELFTEIKGEFLSAKLPAEFENVIKRLEEFAKIATGEPQGDEALMLISRCYSKIGNHERAFSTFVNYAEHFGERVRAQGQDAVDNAIVRTLKNEADELYSKSEFAMAIKFYDLIRTRFPSNSLALKSSDNIARHYYKHCESAQAIEEFSKIIKSHPTSNEARNGYTSLYTLKVNTGDRTGAINLWQDYLKSWPEDEAYVHMNIGTLYFSARQFDKAKEEISKVLTVKNNENYVQSAKQLLEQIEQALSEKSK